MARFIQAVHPNFDLEGDAEAIALAAFWADVDADPLAVVIVMPVDDDEHDASIFSTYARALEHAESLPSDGALIIPKRIDEPHWGNVEVN